MFIKIKSMKYLLSLLLVIIGLSAHSQWAQEKGKGYYKIGVWWLEADQHYTNVGKIDPNTTRGLFISSIFGRYGLSEKLSLVGYIPHTRVYQNKQVFSSGRSTVPGEEFSSLGDINLGLEYQWYRKKGWAISTSLTLGFPTGNNLGGSDGSYQTGDGEFNQIARLHFGRSYRLGNQRFYVKANFGVNQHNRNLVVYCRLSGFDQGGFFIGG